MTLPLFTSAGQLLQLLSPHQLVDPALSCYSSQGKLLPASQRFAGTVFAILYNDGEQPIREFSQFRLSIRKTDKTGFLTFWLPYSMLSQLQNKIYNESSIKPNDQLLYYKGRLINSKSPSDQSLLELGLAGGGIVHLIDRQAVSNWSDTPFLINLQLGYLSKDLYVRGDYSIQLLKKNAASLFNLYEQDILLAYAGTFLTDETGTLDTIDIVPGSYISVASLKPLRVRNQNQRNQSESAENGPLIGKIIKQSQYIIDRQGRNDALQRSTSRNSSLCSSRVSEYMSESQTNRVADTWGFQSNLVKSQVLIVRDENNLIGSAKKTDAFGKYSNQRPQRPETRPLGECTNLRAWR